jgi:ESCRT-II complex subunit VPS22
VDSQVLGSGFEVISVGRRKLVRSVPTELNKDHSGILGLAQVCACNVRCHSTS